jgi:hypothetical protein
MPADRRPVYQERTPWATWCTATLWATLIGSAALVLLLEDGEGLSTGVAVATGLVLLGALLHWLVSGLRVRLFRDHLEASLGHAGLIRTRVAWAEVEETDAVVYSPLREFGGWGYRLRGQKQAWTARGDQAVVLRLRGGREVFVGSDRPARLRERIEAVAGDRLGGEEAAGGGNARGVGADG